MSADGTRTIGHMILRRGPKETGGSSAAILGLKLVGGKILENGQKGAIIEKVKKGSIADVEGQLRPGKRKQFYSIVESRFLLLLFNPYVTF